MRRRLSLDFDVVAERPDVVVLNACTVTALAEKKARQAARRMKRTAPNAPIVLIGCLADAVEKGLATFDEADLLAGGSWRPRVNEAVAEALSGRVGRLPSLSSVSLDDEKSDGPEGRIRAFLKVQDGCGLACAYCRPTQVRGPARSKSIACAVAEARRLDDLGFPEIVLTGINLALYAPGDGHLHDLARSILESTGIRRLRMASINPSGLTDELLALFAEDSRLCPHFHVPLQSGDDRVLEAMRRRYTSAEYLTRIETVRSRIPDATFGADVIVGFPGEDDAAFDATCTLIEQIGYINLHIFRYSPRPGTDAVHLPNPVPEGEKRRRAEALETTWRASRDRLLDKRIGTTQHVLAEAHKDSRWLGYTRDYIHVSFESSANIPLGDERSIQIASVCEGELKGVEEHRDDTC